MVAIFLLTGRFDMLHYKWRVYRYGLDLSLVPLDELGLSSRNANWYSDSGGPNLARVIDAIGVLKGSRVVDIGSGKGGAAFTLSETPFEEVLGVEISQALVHIAEANAKRLSLKSVRFVCSDARAFKDMDSFSHFYMYNPFPCTVMMDVLSNLRESLSRKPRPLTLIYKNPVCHSVIVDSGLFTAEREFVFSKRDHPFRVYFHSFHV